jgi:hypothetical protein
MPAAYRVPNSLPAWPNADAGVESTERQASGRTTAAVSYPKCDIICSKVTFWLRRPSEGQYLSYLPRNGSPAIVEGLDRYLLAWMSFASPVKQWKSP